MGGNGNEMEGLLAWFFFLFCSVCFSLSVFSSCWCWSLDFLLTGSPTLFLSDQLIFSSALNASYF